MASPPHLVRSQGEVPEVKHMEETGLLAARTGYYHNSFGSRITSAPLTSAPPPALGASGYAFL